MKPAFNAGGFINIGGNQRSCEGIATRLLAEGIAQARVPKIYYQQNTPSASKLT